MGETGVITTEEACEAFTVYEFCSVEVQRNVAETDVSDLRGRRPCVLVPSLIIPMASCIIDGRLSLFTYQVDFWGSLGLSKEAWGFVAIPV